MMTRGTNTFMIVLNKKFCAHWTPFAHSAASRFWLIDSILLLKAKSNLSACTISNVLDRTSFPGMTTFPLIIDVSIVHSNVFVPSACVKSDLILIFTPTLVAGLTTKLVIGLDVYTGRFCSVRTQERNHESVIAWLTISVHLFLKRMVSCGLDHWAIIPPLRFSCPGIPGDSSIARSIPCTSPPMSVQSAY